MRVAIAIIKDAWNRVLVTQRPLHTSHGGFWEFPGGKIEPVETAEAALVREIREEVGLEITQPHFLGTIHHQYPSHNVQLLIFLVTHFQGTASCLEDQLDLKWAEISELNKDQFPQANQKIFELLSAYLFFPSPSGRRGKNNSRPKVNPPCDNKSLSEKNLL